MRNALIVAAAAFALGGLTAGSDAQGRGQDKGQGKGAASAQAESRGQAKGQGKGTASTPTQPPGQAKGGSAVAPGQQRGQTGAAGRSAQAPGQQRAAYARAVSVNDVPTALRSHVTSNRRPQVVAGGALARAYIRGVGDDFRLVPANGRVTLTNRRGAVLVSLDDNGARNLGVWQVNAFDAPMNSGSPAFCRSGAGHPVWGRQWCLDKGFGLGEYQDVRWGRTTTIGDVIFGRTIEPGRLTTESLLRVLGATGFNRLALHAVTLGYTEPLVGTWATDPAEPNVLFVNAGPAPVAEMVDVNRDGRPDLMLVALRPW